MTPQSTETGSEPLDFSRRIPQLDGLRGVAIAMVLACHYTLYAGAFGAPAFVHLLWPLFRVGWVGVDLFFVLSGFLIGGILLDARGSANYFRVFYLRRCCRICPVYFAFLLLAWGVLPILRAPVLPPLPVCVLFVQNFWLAAHGSSQVGVLGPTWSLAVEEQFYLLLPALIYFVAPRRLPRLLLWGIAAGPIFRAAVFTLRPGAGMAVFVLLPCRIDSLLTGVAAAYVLRVPGIFERIQANRKRLWTALEALSVISLVWLVLGSRENPLTGIAIYSALSLVFVCLLLLSLVDGVLKSALYARWLRWLGRVSYSIYISHLLVFLTVVRALPFSLHRGLMAAVVALALTLALAAVSWKFFERPILKFGHRVSYAGRSTAVSHPARAVAD